MLVEEKSELGAGRDSYKIVRDPTMPDDFAQAVNIGVMSLCHMTGMWPDLTEYEDIALSDEAYKATFPVESKDWDDI